MNKAFMKVVVIGFSAVIGAGLALLGCNRNPSPEYPHSQGDNTSETVGGGSAGETVTVENAEDMTVENAADVEETGAVEQTGSSVISIPREPEPQPCIYGPPDVMDR